MFLAWAPPPPPDMADRRVLDAQDVAFNLMRIAGKLNPADVTRYQRRTSLDGLNHADAVDPTTVHVVFDRPVSTFLPGVADCRNQFIPRDFIDKGGDFANVASLVGTGPFTIAEHQAGVRPVFKPYANYWVTPAHNFDEVVFTTISNDATRVASLLSGDVDWIDPVPLQDIARVNGSANASVLTGPEFRTTILGMVQTRDALLFLSVMGKYFL